jgi:hypothetical protein
MQRLSRSQNFGGEVSNPEVSDVEQNSQLFSFSYDYIREKYYQWDDHDASHWIGPPLPPMGGELAPGIKQKKPADEPELGSPGESYYHSAIQLPKDWTMVSPKDVDLKEDWAEYLATYSFKDGVLTAERRLIVKMTKIPLDQWEKYLAFRRGMFEDENHQILIYPPKAHKSGHWF